MAACILPCDTVANNESCSNKNDKCSVSETVIVSISGGRDQETKLCLRFYDYEECKILSNTDKIVLRE